MTEKVLALRPDHDLSMLTRLMMEHNVRHVPIVDEEGDLVGLVSHRDLLRSSLIEQFEVPSMVEHLILEQLKVREVMTCCVETVSPETDIREAAQLIWENKFGCLPVLNGRRLVGILTESDFVRLIARGP